MSASSTPVASSAERVNALGERMMRLEYDGHDGEGESLSPRLIDNEFREITATLKEALDVLRFFT